MALLDFATTDLVLSIAHHLLVFAVAGVLAFEIGVIRSGMTDRDILRVARVDIWYGVLAAVIVVVGFLRAVFAAKGWAYYAVNFFFWAKLATFAVVGLLSIAPTLAIIRWRRAQSGHAAALPTPDDIGAIRRILFAEAMLFALIPAFAAAMARGYGELAP
jgi:putative membrane protein